MITNINELKELKEKRSEEMILKDNGVEIAIKIKKLSVMDLAVLEDFPSILLFEVMDSLEKKEDTKKKDVKQEAKKDNDIELAKKIKPLVDVVFKHVILEPSFTEIKANNLEDVFTFNMKLQVFNKIFSEQEKLIPSSKE